MRELILGGARSGKSRLALVRASASNQKVIFIATASAGDAEMQARIAAHRAERPASWQTVEAPLALADALRKHAAPGCCLIVDCITLWLTNLLCSDEAYVEQHSAPPPVAHAEMQALLETLPSLPGHVILVSNEVGLGLVPESRLSRVFRDEQGRINQSLAGLCERVVFVAAGLSLVMKGE